MSIDRLFDCSLFYFRMTDLGSVVFTDVDKPGGDMDSPSQPQNGGVYKKKATGKRSKPLPRQPSTILESPENTMLDSGIDDGTGNQITGSTEDVSQLTTETIDPVISDLAQNDVSCDNVRNSLCSEGEFGSHDMLTDNDSLEMDKVGYHNVVADVTVHQDNRNSKLTVQTSDSIQMNGDCSGHVDHTSMCNSLNDGVRNDCAKSGSSNESDLPNDNTECDIEVSGRTVEKVIETSDATPAPLDTEEIKLTVRQESVDLGKLEQQILPNDSQVLNEVIGKSSDVKYANENDRINDTSDKGIHSAESDRNSGANGICDGQELTETVTVDGKLEAMPKPVNGANKTDVNKHQSKGSVRFKEQAEGEIREDKIVPTEAVPVEGTPPKKDALFKRETWASRKLRKTFKLNRQEREEEDQLDGRGMNCSFCLYN